MLQFKFLSYKNRQGATSAYSDNSKISTFQTSLRRELKKLLLIPSLIRRIAKARPVKRYKIVLRF